MKRGCVFVMSEWLRWRSAMHARVSGERQMHGNACTHLSAYHWRYLTLQRHTCPTRYESALAVGFFDLTHNFVYKTPPFFMTFLSSIFVLDYQYFMNYYMVLFRTTNYGVCLLYSQSMRCTSWWINVLPLLMYVHKQRGVC